MRFRFPCLLMAVALVGVTSNLAQAQGSFFSSLSGTVPDSSGGVIPGANVKIKNNGTGEEFNTVTGNDGGFTVPSLPGGTYSVEVSLSEFLNAFNKPYFNTGTTAGGAAGTPLGFTNNFTQPQGPFQTGTPFSNAIAGTSVDSFRLTQLLSDNQSRTVQLVWRVKW
jgi:hypothetical protein